MECAVRWRTYSKIAHCPIRTENTARRPPAKENVNDDRTEFTGGFGACLPCLNSLVVLRMRNLQASRRHVDPMMVALPVAIFCLTTPSETKNNLERLHTLDTRR